MEETIDRVSDWMFVKVAWHPYRFIKTKTSNIPLRLLVGLVCLCFSIILIPVAVVIAAALTVSPPFILMGLVLSLIWLNIKSSLTEDVKGKSPL